MCKITIFMEKQKLMDRKPFIFGENRFIFDRKKYWEQKKTEKLFLVVCSSLWDSKELCKQFFIAQSRTFFAFQKTMNIRAKCYFSINKSSNDEISFNDFYEMTESSFPSFLNESEKSVNAIFHLDKNQWISMARSAFKHNQS